LSIYSTNIIRGINPLLYYMREKKKTERPFQTL